LDQQETAWFDKLLLQNKPGGSPGGHAEETEVVMNINSVELIYFSPTRTTKKIVEAIARGIHADGIRHHDLTYPSASVKQPHSCGCDLAIIGAPVYAGRLPETMISRFKPVKGHATPAVIVVVYGNRACEDALLELQDLVSGAGFIPVAAAAFIGEHSYATKEFPIAAGRPDLEDIQKAGAFGAMVREKVSKIIDSGHILPPRPPGNFPYKEARILSGVSPFVDENLCTGCMVCIPACPTSALREDDPPTIDKDLCIRCSACIKSCPDGAITMNDPGIRQIAAFLFKTCPDRKEPEIYMETEPLLP